ncbi:MAG TPA: c(7)-type cytochrome triheme domain-containing protein [Nitrospirota bacterium]
MFQFIPLRCRYLAVCLIAVQVFTLFISSKAFSQGSRGNLDLPTLLPPDEYGDVVIDRFSGEKKIMPVLFSHRLHRVKYTCRVCHGELDFSMKASDTGVVCGGGEMTGKYCTICHDNKTAFGPKGTDGEKNCRRCHSADESPDWKKYAELKQKLPPALYGDEINWAKALTDGLIRPKKSLRSDFKPVILDRTLTLRAEMSGIPPAVFPHKIHSEWLDCDICHPDIFNIKKKTTKHFSMWRILNKEFCGVCHLSVAFPMNECERCHPAMTR